MAALATPPPLQLSVTWWLGSTWLLVLGPLTGPDGGELVAAGISDVQFRIASSSAVLLDANFATEQVSLPDPAQPYALVNISPDVQAGFAAGAYSYEARVITSNGGAFEQQYGQLTLKPSLFNQFTPPPIGGALNFQPPTNSGAIPVL